MSWIYRDKYKNRKTGEIREAETWMMALTGNGKLKRVSTETTNRNEALKIMRAADAGSDKGVPVFGARDKITLAEGAALIIHDYKIRKLGSMRSLRYRLDTLLSFFGGDLRLDEIKSSAPPGVPSIHTYIDKRQDEDKVENGTINRETANLKRIYKLAMIAERIAFMPHIPKLEENGPREGFFEPEQFASVCAHLGQEVLVDVAIVAMITGWRTNSEILTLERDQIEFGSNVMWVTKTKGNKKRKRREFPLTGELRDVFERRFAIAEQLRAQRVITPLVFFRVRRRQRPNLIGATTRAKRELVYHCPACHEPVTATGTRGRLLRYCNDACRLAARRSGLAAKLATAPRQLCADPIKTFYKAWHNATRLAGCPGRLPHDFRRTAVRNSRREGIDEGVCMKLHGHETRAVADNYNITGGGDIAEAGEKLEDIIARKAAGASAARAKLAEAMRGRK